MDKINYVSFLETAKEQIITYTPRVIIGIAVLWLGFKITSKVIKSLNNVLEKSGFNENTRPFLLSILDIILKVIIIMVVANILGANLTGLVAVLAAAGFAVGMALQGSLGNFASGILIMILKPYKIGDWINVGEKFGKVEEISIFNTTLVSPGQKTLIIPNSKITDDIVTNYSNRDLIRLELEVTMPYDEDFSKVKEIIRNALQDIPKILDEPKTDIGITAYDTHSIRIAVLPFVKPDDYWEVTYETYSNIKRAFSEHGIRVAYSEGVEMGSIGK